MFDVEHNGVIKFGKFVRSLSIFHPSTPDVDKIACKLPFELNNYLIMISLEVLILKYVTAGAFRLYDLRGTGFIEQEEVS